MQCDNWTFGTRQRTSGDDGGDFESFVLECFRVCNDEAGFIRSLRRGRDGAIDLIDLHGEPGETTIAECKYIGRGGLREAKGRWTEVFRHLETNLPALEGDPVRRLDSPYRTWLDPDRPVRRYRFCVSVSLSANDIRQLENQIRNDLKRLIKAGCRSLEGLCSSDGSIKVLSWDWFHTELNLAPALAYRWFGGLPIGISLFDPAGRVGQTFRDFLGGAQLPYFSRDAFAATEPNVQIRGERELAARIAAGEKTALVLAGPGGVGKTRLAHELALSLTLDPAGFDCYWLDRSAGASSINELAASYTLSSPILLLVDYAEAVDWLGEVADAIAHLNSQHGHKFAIVVTCRSSAQQRVEDEFEPLDPQVKRLTSVDRDEAAYLDWVTNAILALEPFPDPTGLIKVCHSVPALAAFAVFLFRNHRSNFDEQFGSLLASKDFASWSNHRINAILKDKAINPRDLARVALALPIAREDHARSRESYRDVLDRLLSDRWIEAIDGELSAAHDILADALLAHWLLAPGAPCTNRVIDLLGAAANDQDLPHALTVLARLVHHPEFKSLDGRAVIAALNLQAPGQVLASASPVLGGPLLSVTAKLDLLDNNPDLLALVRADQALQVTIARIAADVAERRAAGEALVVCQSFIELLDVSCAQSQGSNFVLRRAYALDPDHYRSSAYASIAQFPAGLQTHFLIVQMLRSGEPPDRLRGAVEAWLAPNSATEKASFVYRAWLHAKGDLEPVKPQVLDWLSQYGLIPEASFVYAAWLHAKGDLETVKPRVVAWLSQHGLTPEAQFVYTAWLNAKGDPETVKPRVVAWLSQHGLIAEARFVYAAWLNAKGDLALVRPQVLDWLGQHGLASEAGLVYTTWLDAKGDFEAIKPKVMDWLGQHGLTSEAGFVYTAWLNAKDDMGAVKPQVLAWLGQYGLTAEAQFVYAAWLNAKDDLEAIKPQVLAWLGQYGLTAEAQFVYAAWLNAKDDLEAIKPQVLAWLGQYGLTAEAQFVYAAWLNAKGDPDLINKAMFAWIELHGTAREADFVFRAWINAGGQFAAVAQSIYAWTALWSHEDDFVYLSKELSKRRNLPEPVILAIANWASHHPGHEDCLYRLSRLIGSLRPNCLSPAGVETLSAHLFTVVADNRQPPLLGRQQLWLICNRLAEDWMVAAAAEGVIAATAAIVCQTDTFDGDLTSGNLGFLDASHERICRLLCRCLETGAIVSARDGSKLAAFRRWLEATHPEPADVAGLLAMLDRAAPSPIWG